MIGALAPHLQRLPELLAAHVLLSFGAMVLGIAISLPLAFWALRSRAVRTISLGVASVMQTVPSIALLAFMVVALGLFREPAALIGLTVYSVLPVLRNTITGIEGVNPSVVDAARGVGMTPAQVLWRVQLPLALPVMIAGVRIATVWVIGIATLGTPVGARCLGEFIFSGLQLRDNAMLGVGIASAALLAVVIDQLIGLIEVGARDRRRGRAVLGGVGLGAVFALSVLTPWLMRSPVDLRVGAKTFTEQYILAEVIAGQLRDEGFAVETTGSLGSAAVFDALANGDVDVYVDYTGTIWANYMKREGSASRSEMLNAVTVWALDERGVTVLGPLGFENAYALAMRAGDADRLGVRTITDLARVGGSLSIGGDYEFFGRPEWQALVDTYGLQMGEQVSMDSTLMYEAVAQGQVDVISAFSTDGRIAAYDLRVLEDTAQALPPYDAVLLLTEGAAADPRVRGALQDLIGAIDDELMRRANMIVDVDRGTIGEAVDSIERSLGGGAD